VALSTPPIADSPHGLLQQIRRLGQQLKSHPLDKEAPELRERLKELEELASFEVARDEIAAASEKLEAHRAEFKAMMADPPAAMERAQRLFSEEPFAALRFSPDDLQGAFEEVGYLSWVGEEPSHEDMETMVATMLHLAGDEENRQRLARQLLRTLPEYVAARRYHDAWLIQHSAFLLIEDIEQGCPFLFAMFQLAFKEWERRAEEEQEALMRELGLDPSALRGSGTRGIETTFRQLMADPRNIARLEAFYEAHPELRDQATAELTRLEHGALRLLERDDAQRLALPPEEVGPWLMVLMERLGPVNEQYREAAKRGERPSPEAAEKMKEQLLAVTEEMAPAVYTPERIDQLMADLEDYRRSLDKAGEREASRWAHGALAYLQVDVPPADNRFLHALCFLSLRSALQAARAAGADAEQAAEG
jgi:hypothetical protein